MKLVPFRSSIARPTLFAILLFFFSCNNYKQKEEAVSEIRTVQEIVSLDKSTSIDSKWKADELVQSNESYQKATENPFKSTVSNPLSTFSIDVDRASYANIRRMILDKTEIPANSVRIEEMINYFDYKYPQPTSEHPFAINSEYSNCPWNSDHRLLKIGVQGKTMKTENLPPSNLVFLLDVSGSMDEPNKLPLLKSSMELLINQLTEKDKVSIVVYAGETGVVLEPTSGNQKLKIKQSIRELKAGGATGGEEGLKLAYKLAKKSFIENGNNRIILATDGDFNLGLSTDEEMIKLIEEKRKSGVYLTCLGFGSGNFKDSKMEILANKGNGNYAYIDNISEANKFLGKEFGGTIFTIAKDVKIQIEFNPSIVNAYRLIGYENRMLENEDFKDDKKDAGELGSGHQVTALYEIIPVGVNSKFLKNIDPLKYAEQKNLNSSELATIKFRYKKPKEDKSIEMVNYIVNGFKPIDKTTKDFKFCSAVAMFGLMLSESKYTNPIQPNQILRFMKEGDIINDEYRNEFVELINLYKQQN